MGYLRRFYPLALPVALFLGGGIATVVVSVRLGTPASDMTIVFAVLALATVLNCFGVRALLIPDGRNLGIRVSRLATAAGGLGIVVGSFLGLAYDAGPGRTTWIESPGLMVVLTAQVVGTLVVFMGLRAQRADPNEPLQRAALWKSLLGSAFGVTVLIGGILLVGYDTA